MKHRIIFIALVCVAMVMVFTATNENVKLVSAARKGDECHTPFVSGECAASSRDRT